MERSEHRFRLRIIVLLLLLSKVSFGQMNGEQLSCRLLEDYITGNKADWEAVLRDNSLDSVHSISDQLVYTRARYGLIGILLEAKRKTDASRQIEILEQQLQALLKQNPTHPELMSMYAGLNGFKISLQPFKAPIYGRIYNNRMDEIKGANLNNPYVLFERGNSLFYRPAIFGGDKKEAIKLWEEADRQFEADSKGNCNWYALHLKVMLIKGYEEIGETRKALILKTTVRVRYPKMEWLR